MKTQDPLKPAGTWETRRKITIPTLVHANDSRVLEQAVSELSGVRKVLADEHQHQITIRYDASQMAYQSIVEILKDTGFPPLNNWWNRFKGGWYQSFDINARDNANAPPPTCCNKPPK